MLIVITKPPVRVQRKRTKNWKMPENTVFVGRPSKWGNPYKIGYSFEYDSYFTRDNVIREFTSYLFKSNLIDDILELRGKNLACWCSEDDDCHADILLDLANRPKEFYEND